MPRWVLAAVVAASAALVVWLAADLRRPVQATAGAPPPPAATQAPTTAAPPPAAEPAASTPVEPRPEPEPEARPERRPAATARPPAAAPAPARSRALGLPFRKGRLVGGVLLPTAGPDFVSWDAPLQRMPNRSWRRWGTDRLVAVLLQVMAEHRAANPGAPRLLVGDLSRPRGGSFDARYGGLGHASHQNGLDVDVYYPRKDRRLVEPRTAADVDRRLAQDLVDRFVAAGAEVVFVGGGLRLRGVGGRGAKVQVLPHHDDHLHVRIPNPGRG